MLEEIKALEAAGRWADLLQLADTLPQGDALARVHLALSSYHENRATDAVGYRLALQHAQKAVVTADLGSLMHTWAYSKVAAYAADLADYRMAEQAAAAYLAGLPSNPRAEANAAVVYFALARVRAAQQDFAAAVHFWQMTEACASPELAERARLHRVWTLSEAGRASEAAQALPDSVSHISEGHLSAARAIVAAAIGDWQAARDYAQHALRSRAAGEWAIYDIVQAAQLLLILKKSAVHLGHFKQAAVWALHTAATLAGWNAALMTRLLPTLPGEGGVWTDVKAASSCGPTGYRRTGLLGTVG